MSTQARGWRRHYTLFLLFMVSAVSLIDRQIMGIVIEPIKAEFHVTDTQIGLLTGLGFSLVYCLFAIPIGRFADRANRRNLIGLCCAGWSAMTLLCGCATSYWGLALARLGVAIGESGSGAASMSMIADLYPPHQRAKAISVFMLGAPIGALLGLSAGAWIAYDYGWRQAFVWVAVPGLVTAVLLRLSGWEPRRGTWESPTAGSTPHESLWPVLRGAWQCSPLCASPAPARCWPFPGMPSASGARPFWCVPTGSPSRTPARSWAWWQAPAPSSARCPAAG